MPDKNLTKPHYSDIRCKGRILATGESCNQLIGTTDGERVFINGLALHLDPPRVKCDRCGFVMYLKQAVKGRK